MLVGTKIYLQTSERSKVGGAKALHPKPHETKIGPTTAFTSSNLSTRIAMFANFALRHVPPLLVATALTFGGLMPFFNAEDAILEFGLPKRIASPNQHNPS
jgi:hypothetical protein